MSRLGGRVVFPESSSGTNQHSLNDERSEVSSEAQDNQKTSGDQPRRRGRGFNKNNQGPERFEKNDRNDERWERDQPSRQRNDRSGRSETFYKSERNQRYERPQKSYKTERFERSERGERQERREDPVEKPRKPTARVEDVVKFEELLEVEDIIAQISDLTVRSDRSAAQIKRNILGSKDLLDTMSEDDWQEVCEAMVNTALDQGEPEFIADLVVALFHIETFTAVMSEELTVVSSEHILEQDGKPIPALLANILCAFWPRQFSKAFDKVNLILYYVVSLVKGWVQIVSDDTGRYYKEEKKPKYPVREEEEEEKEEQVEEEQEKVIEEPEVVNQCALSLSELCDTAQKQLWIKWAEETDEIYQCLKPAITHNPNISGDVKARLLNTFLQINQWSKNRSTSVKHSQTQTVSTSSD